MKEDEMGIIRNLYYFYVDNSAPLGKKGHTVKKFNENDDDLNNEKLNKLLKILNQMVIDGDLSESSVELFKKEIDFNIKKKEVDPLGEEDWDEENVILDRKKLNKPKRAALAPGGRVIPPQRNNNNNDYDPCGGRAYAANRC